MKKLFLLFFVITFSMVGLAQNVGVDIATPQQKLDVAGALKIGSTTTGVAGSLRWTGTEFQFHDGTSWVTLNANTDDQVLDVIQLNGTDLEISIESDGQATNVIDLSAFLDNTDEQTFDQVAINGSNQLLLSLENDGLPTHVLDLSGYLDNTDDQTLDIVQLNGSNLELSLEDDGQATNVVDLSSFLDNTDDQALDVAQLTGTNLELSLEDDGVATEVIDLSGFMDNTDDQQFDVVNITSDELRLSLEADGQATHVLDLTPYKDNTDDQQFDVIQLTGNSLELSLEDDGQATHSIDLSTFADNTDDQTIDVLSLAGNTLNISLEDDGVGNETLDLSQFMDNTDDQQLNDFSVSGNILSLNIEDAGGIQTVNLAPYLDNTDNQEITQFNLSGNTLQITLEDDAGGQETVDLSGYLDNTDDQAVTTFSLSGTDLQLQVESDAGGLQTVDLDPLRRLLVDADGDTKVEVEQSPDEDHIRFTTAGNQAMFIDNAGNVGIGSVNGATENQLVIHGTGSDSRAVLGLRGGNAVTTFNGGPQIAFGYDTDDSYQHFIHTRHNSAGGSTNNAIDFYVSDGTQNNTVTSGSTHVMSLNSGNVGVGTTTPGRKLDVQGGGIRVSGLSSANQLVISDADGDLVNLASLVGTGMGDNLGNHTATTTLNMSNNAIDNAGMVDITAGNGNGVRFWGSNNYKISMGNSTDYRYGDVQEYSIKMNMNNDAQGDRGWTWGVDGQTPVASISNAGHMTLNGSLFFDCVNCGSSSDPYPIGGSGWGDMVIQGRVMSANSNLHLSPPAGYNVVINDTYRSAGGSSSGSAGLEVESLSGGGNQVVLANNSGQLYTGSLTGTGLGDNLGNHSATQLVDMNGYDLDFERGDQGQIRSVGRISFDWTSGTYDASSYHGIESENESGNLGDEIRINSYNDIVNTIDANNNDGTSYFKVQHHSSANGADLLTIASPGGEMWFGRGNGSNRMYLDDNGIYLYNGWFRNHGGTGLYNQDYGNHWYATDANYWISRSNRGIVLRNVGNTTRGYLYHDNGDSFGLLDRDGTWAVRTVRDQYVEFRDNDEVMMRVGAGGVGGNYGSVSTYGGGKGGWEGYSINDRYVFMSADASTMGLYNDVDNRWVMYHVRNDRTDFYEPDGGAVSFRVDNNENQMFRDLNMTDDDIWDVGRLTVNTIYDTDGTDIVHFDQTRVRFDVGSSRDWWVMNYAGHPQIRPGSAGYGFIGQFNNYPGYIYSTREYRTYEYGLSDRRVKQNIQPLDGSNSLEKVMSLQGTRYDLNKETHPFLGIIENEQQERDTRDNLGFIAQELMQVVPEMVVLDEESGYYMIKNYEQLLPIMVEAMKEQQKQINLLLQRIEGLERDKN